MERQRDIVRNPAYAWPAAALLDLVGQPSARTFCLLFRDSTVLASSAESFFRGIDEAVQAEQANAVGTKRGTRSRAPRA
ncbi:MULTISPECIES: hypothetical protein [Burkholderia]|uniref:hypothetical protein n=1 Tax=Burkholderia TaxID=32008 RepID=UPI0013DDCF1E|nr:MULTISPECIES: hypothetical protein [Burkholderia]